MDNKKDDSKSDPAAGSAAGNDEKTGAEKEDQILNMEETFGNPDYASIGENGEFNLFKVSFIIFVF